MWTFHSDSGPIRGPQSSRFNFKNSSAPHLLDFSDETGFVGMSVQFWIQRDKRHRNPTPFGQCDNCPRSVSRGNLFAEPFIRLESPLSHESNVTIDAAIRSP